MNRRERMLLAILVCGAMLIGGNYLFRTQYQDQIRQRLGRLQLLQDSVEQHRVELARIAAAKKSMDAWAARSLPPDSSTAVVLCQNWLIELAQNTGLESTIVSPNQVATEGDAWNRIPFTVKARAELNQVCDFLESLQQVSLLHKITQLQLSAAEPSSDPILDVTIQIEALALATADPGSMTLPHEHAIVWSDQTGHRRQDYTPIVTGNRFARLGTDDEDEEDDDEFDLIAPAALAAIQQSQSRPTQPDRRQHVFLVASLSSGNQPMAWLYDRQRKQKIVLRPGRAFSVGKTNGKVLSVARDSVVYSSNGQTRRLVMGNSLLEASPFRARKSKPIRRGESASVN